MTPIDFSIVTVTLNSAETLHDTLVSVAQQKEVSVQHIIKDGGSSDGTLSMARDMGSDVELITQDDIGIYDAMNQGFAAARGEYVGFLNSDDFFSFDTVLSEIAELFEREEADIVYGDIEIINAQGKLTRHWRSGYWVGPAWILQQFCQSFGSYQLGLYHPSDRRCWGRRTAGHWKMVSWAGGIFRRRGMADTQSKTVFKGRIFIRCLCARNRNAYGFYEKVAV